MSRSTSNPYKTVESSLRGALDTSSVASATLENFGDTLAVPLGVGLHVLDVDEPVSLLPKEVGVKRCRIYT